MYITSTLEPDGQLVSLELTDLKLDDAGQVKVVAVNSEGDASTAARLTVIGGTILFVFLGQHMDQIYCFLSSS